MADDLDMLYDEPKGEPPAPAPPPAPAAPSPELEDLRRELYQTKGLLAGLAQQRQGESQPVRPAESQPSGWQDKEFLSEGEERLLLESTKPRETLNKMFNTVAKSVHENFASELQKRDAYLAQVAQGSQQYAMQEQQARATQHFQTRFYEQHADLKGEDILVQQAAQVAAQEYATAPWRFGTADAVLTRIGELARETKNATLARWSGGGTQEGKSSPGVQSPARRAAMETGGSTRIGLPSPPKDGQAKALGAMIDHVKGGRR